MSVVVAFWEAVFEDFDVGFADDFDFVIFETIDRRNFVGDGKKNCFEKRIFYEFNSTVKPCLDGEWGVL